MEYTSVKREQMELRQQIVALCDQYVEQPAEHTLTELSGCIERLTGLNFRQQLVQSSDGHPDFERHVRELADGELGRQIITNEGIAGQESRVSLPKAMSDMMDLSVPLLNPLLCEVFLDRLRQRFEMPNAQVHVRGTEKTHAVTLHSLDGQMGYFLHEGDVYSVESTRLYLMDGEKTMTLSSAVERMTQPIHKFVARGVSNENQHSLF